MIHVIIKTNDRNVIINKKNLLAGSVDFTGFEFLLFPKKIFKV